MNPLHLLILLAPWLTLFFQRTLTWQRAVLGGGVTCVLSMLNLLAPPGPVDELTLWLLPYCALIYTTLLLCVPRAERSPSLLRALLLGLGLDMLFFSLQSPVAMALVWPLTMLPLFSQLTRARPRRFMAFFMLPSCVLFAAGALSGPSYWGMLALVAALCLRKAVFPVHQWLPALIEEAPWSATIAFCSPQLAAYAAVRLLSPHAPEGVLVGLGALALLTSLYGACLALGNPSLRGVYASLFMGQTSLVFTGLQCTTEAGLAGGLAVWLSGGLALTGLGATIWVLEARRGRLELDRYHGGYDRSPVLAGCYLILGLSSVGFPGTAGFISQELLLDGTLHVYTHVGVLAALTACLNGITVMSSYFHAFCGSRQEYSPSQSIRPRERLAMVMLLAVLLGCGLFPQAFLASRSRIAETILVQRSR